MASRAHAASPELVDRAVAAARDAAAGWAATSYGERCERLRAVAGGISERHLELAAVASLEAGKVRTESIAEVQEAVDLITTYTDHMEQNDGYERPLDSFVADERNTDVLRPYGVFAVIRALQLPGRAGHQHGRGPLIAGNSVVLKPSEETPRTGAILAGRPGGRTASGSAQRDPRRPRHRPRTGGGRGGRCGVRLESGRRSPDGCRKGPSAAGAHEMGGKNPAIVTAAADLDKAAEGVARAAFGLSGQKCSACSRAVVVESVHDEFVERLVAFSEGLDAGDPPTAASSSGPWSTRPAWPAGGGRGRRRWPRRLRGRRGWPAGTCPVCSSSPPWSPACHRATGSSATSCSSRS